jgi:hypothetical protein
MNALLALITLWKGECVLGVSVGEGGRASYKTLGQAASD